MYKQVIAVRRDLKLGKGKLAAQVAHASLAAYKNATPYARESWEEDGSKKIVVRVENKRELLILKRKAASLPTALIHDAGKTQVQKGEITALAIGPARERDIDPITKTLTLL